MGITISRESYILFLICLADVVVTIGLIAAGLAEEANPWMARLLDYGYVVFFVVKMSTVVAAIIVAESYARQNPLFTKRVLQITIVSYVALYVVLVTAVNMT